MGAQRRCQPSDPSGPPGTHTAAGSAVRRTAGGDDLLLAGDGRQAHPRHRLGIGHRDQYETSRGTTRSGPMSETEKAERRTVVANSKRVGRRDRGPARIPDQDGSAQDPAQRGRSHHQRRGDPRGHYGTSKHPIDARAVLSLAAGESRGRSRPRAPPPSDTPSSPWRWRSGSGRPTPAGTPGETRPAGTPGS